MATIDVLVPVAAARVHERPLADRVAGLAGRRVGVLENQKANAALLTRTIVEELAARSGPFEIVSEHKAAPAGAPAEVMGRLQRCDAVVLAIAD